MKLESRAVTKRGDVTMVAIDKTLVVIGRRYRSKWWIIECVGCGPSRRRRDGTCRHERRVLSAATPAYRERTRIKRK